MRSAARAARLVLGGALLLAGTRAVAQDAGPGGQLLAGMASPGYSGLAVTPTARPLDWGQVALGYDTALPADSLYPRGHNFLLGVGLLPGLEVAGRLASNDLQCNDYGFGRNPCREPLRRDLSASVKLGHSVDLPGWPGTRLSGAIGATDLGGAATRYRSTYAVLGLSQPVWSATFGRGRAVSSEAPLDGWFAGLAWRAHDTLQLQLEQVGSRRWLGARLVLPAAWRHPQVQPWLAIQHSLQHDRFAPRQWWGIGVTVALDAPSDARHRSADPGGPTASPPRARSMDAAPGTPAAATGPQTPAVAGVLPGAMPGAMPGARDGASDGTRASGSAAGSTASAAAAPPGTADRASGRSADARLARLLARQLAHAGFADIHIGRHPDGRLRVDLHNNAYAWHDLDALGVALGLLSRPEARPGGDARPGADAVTVVLRKRGIAVLRADGSRACWWRWLQPGQDGATAADMRADRRSDGGCAEGQPGAPRLRAAAQAQAASGRWPADADPDAPADGADDPTWWVRGEQPLWQRPHLMLTPDLDTRVGTEYGALDSTWGLGLNLQWPLWRGAHADVAYVQALGHSADFAEGGPFDNFRIDSQLYRVMLHQAVTLAPGLTARAAVGRLFKRLDGGLAEVAWQPGEGRHRVWLESAEFDHTQVDFTKRSTMLGYRYHVAALDTHLELRAGRFWHGDRGALLVSRHWFGDVNVALYGRRSRFPEGSPRLYSPYGSHYVNAVGLEFTFPLTPRRDGAVGPLAVRGADRFGYGVQTVVGKKTTNYLTPWFGQFAPVGGGLAGSVDSMDRSAPVIVQAQRLRLREAWRTLGLPLAAAQAAVAADDAE